MKFIINKEQFVKGLQIVQSVIHAQHTTTILYNVLLEAQDNQLKITATDLSMSLQYVLDDVEVKVPGATTLHARRLLGLARELPGDKIEILVDDKNVAVLQSASSNYKIYGISAEEFQDIEFKETDKVLHLDQGVFREMLKKTVYAASTDESRRVLNGVLFSVDEQKLIVVATDGRRMALIEQEVEIPLEAKINVIIPTKTVNELIKVLDDEGSLKIQVTPDMMAFEREKITILSKLQEGNFPNYRQVIPSHCEEKVVLEREVFLAALRRVSQLSKEKSAPIKLTFKDNQLRVFTSVVDVGEAEEIMPIKYQGKEFNMGFNPDYLIDPLRNLVADEVYLEIMDDLSPAVLKCDIPFLYVMMPLRLG